MEAKITYCYFNILLAYIHVLGHKVAPVVYQTQLVCGIVSHVALTQQRA